MPDAIPCELEVLPRAWHRQRLAGTPQVHRPGKLPDIGHRHFLNLFKTWNPTHRTARA